jgi:hypothetical protein
MKQPQNGRSRRYAMLIRRLGTDPVGTRLQLRTEKFEELKEKRIVVEYIGPWPPKIKKTKFNLKDLR